MVRSAQITLFMTLLATWPAWMGQQAHAQEKDKTAEIKQLLMERSDLLDKLVEDRIREYDQGICDVATLFDALRDRAEGQIGTLSQGGETVLRPCESFEPLASESWHYSKN